jgi:uncharacterized membrane protein
MQLSDYSICIIAADAISGGLVNANPIPIIFGVLSYFIWEKYRKWEISNNG